MRIRFQADADLNQSIVVGLLRRLPEVDVLALAARDGRVLVTHDKSTMPTHFGEFIRTRQSPGVVVVLQSMPVGTVLDELTLIWGASQASERGRSRSGPRARGSFRHGYETRRLAVRVRFLR